MAGEALNRPDRLNVRNMGREAKGRRYSIFGVTDQDYKFMLEFQRHSCGICQRHRDNFKKDFAVDHCHEIGRVRGLLCGSCNTALGLLKDNRKLVERASRWLMTDAELGLD